MSLKYTGRGRHLVGIPAADLSEAEVAALAVQRGLAVSELTERLVRSGLYKPAKEK